MHCLLVVLVFLLQNRNMTIFTYNTMMEQGDSFLLFGILSMLTKYDWYSMVIKNALEIDLFCNTSKSWFGNEHTGSQRRD